MIYLRMGLQLLQASGLVTKLLLAAGLGVALLTAYGVWHHRVYQQGVNDTLAGIAREDAKWIKRALDARGKLKDCADLGRHWDQTEGRCL